MSIRCPKCGSVHIVTLNRGKKTGAALGTPAGTFAALSSTTTPRDSGVLSGFNRSLWILIGNTGVLSVDAAQALREKHPNIIFRLHAIVRLSPQNQFIDLCDAPTE